VGLTASVHTDPLTREWTLEGGRYTRVLRLSYRDLALFVFVFGVGAVPAFGLSC
jgi:hypothetical protein